MAQGQATQTLQPSAADMRLVIAASSAGTIFEWYDFLHLRHARRDHRQDLFPGRE